MKRKKSKSKKGRWIWSSLLSLAIIISAVYFSLFYSGIQLKNIVIFGNDKITTRELQDIVSTDAHTSLIKFLNLDVTSGSIFLVDTGKINSDILKKFPIIEKIKINKNLPQTLTLGITERAPVGIYCGTPPDKSRQCFLIDENGVAYEPSDMLTDSFPVVRQAINENNVYVGEQVVAQNIISGVSKIQKDLKDNFQINLKDALVTSPIRMNVTTDGGWQIYFNVGSGDPDIDSQITKLNLLLNETINPDARKTLQYIDLRFKDRAIYK